MSNTKLDKITGGNRNKDRSIQTKFVHVDHDSRGKYEPDSRMFDVQN